MGSLPVIADFSRRLDIAGIVDRACPMRDVGAFSHGQVIEALIANRLTSPKAMVAVADWAHTCAVDEVYGIAPDALNDDRLGRALDALADQVDRAVGSVGAKAIDVFGIDAARLHWDMTSISLYGAYQQPDDDHPAPAFGHPKDRRTDLKQIQAGLAVAADGGIPLFHRAYDDNAAEIAQVTDSMHALQDLAAPRWSATPSSFPTPTSPPSTTGRSRSSHRWRPLGYPTGCSPASTPAKRSSWTTSPNATKTNGSSTGVPTGSAKTPWIWPGPARKTRS